jgi:PAS domain-containing protein
MKKHDPHLSYLIPSLRGQHRLSSDPSRGSGTLDWDRFILGLKKTTKEFIENVLENIIESIVVTNLEGRLIFFNRFSEELFGYRARVAPLCHRPK